jgi:hypothetical protein
MATSQPMVPQSYSGAVHYQLGFALLDIAGLTNWVLLILDSPFTGAWDFNRAAQSTLYMQQRYVEGAPASLHGVILGHLIDGQQRQVLHIF